MSPVGTLGTIRCPRPSERVFAGWSTAGSEVARRGAANGEDAKRCATDCNQAEGRTTDSHEPGGHTAHCEDAPGTAPHGKDSPGSPAHGNEARSGPPHSEDTASIVAQRNDAVSGRHIVAARAPLTKSNRDQRQAADPRLRLVMKAPPSPSHCLRHTMMLPEPPHAGAQQR
jgi:hypothetical protein